MEGPNIRRYPRTYFSCPIELCAGGKTLHLKRALGNLSIHGLFVHGEKLPIGESVHVTIACSPPFDIDGNVRFSDAEGVGIEFIDLNDAHRKRVDELIAEFLPREVLAGRKGQ
jgi:hypothetical protein